MKCICFTVTLLALLQFSSLQGQPNCAYYYPEGSDCRTACFMIERVFLHPQGSWQSQQGIDGVLRLCPEFAYGWQQKSIPFLKRGDYATWRKYLDKAVEIEPTTYLGYRAGCLFDALHDYTNCLADLERLENLTKSKNVGMNPGGELDLRIIKALCLRELGKKEACLETFEETIRNNEEKQNVGNFEYFYFGTTLYHSGRYEDALVWLKKQETMYKRFAETSFYLACVYEKMKQPELAKAYLLEAEKNYKDGFIRKDPYQISWPDQIYLKDILTKLNSYK